jgi:hypothetical protein
VTPVPLGHFGKTANGTDVGGSVGNEQSDVFIGDDQSQRRQAMTATLTPPSETANAPAADERCDRSNAAGKLRIVLAGGGELVFCGHHANKYAEDLVKIAVTAAADEDFVWRGTELTSN